MEKGVETKRVWLFVAFAFGIAWTIDLVIYVTGGLSDLGVGSLAWILLVVSMAAPFLANILTRLVTREGWRDLYLRPRFKRSWRFWATAWLGTPLLVLLGAGLFYALFPQYLDTTLSTAQALLDQATESTGRPVPMGPMAFIVIQIVQTIVTAPWSMAQPRLVKSLAGGLTCCPSSCPSVDGRPRSWWVSSGVYGTGRSSPWATTMVLATLVHRGWACWPWLGSCLSRAFSWGG